MKKIHWGIIGCGNVTEQKSGPAFNKVPNSALVAVMRRDAAKAADYARRHDVPRWYQSADELINDPQVNAVYIATPPSSHEAYSIAALQAGKPVYVEKPITLSALSAKNIATAVEATGGKLSVAHYRRQQPYFKKIKSLIDEGLIGNIRYAQLQYCKKALSPADLQKPGIAWRVDPALSGGGLFHDLAPHQLDLMLYFFGAAEKAQGMALNQSKLYAADDLVTGSIQFNNGVVFNGLWCFNVDEWSEEDNCVITGEKGSIRFSVFGPQTITLAVGGRKDSFSFTPPEHVQQPMIEAVVKYFLDEGPNPCPVEQGIQVMSLMDAFTAR